MCVCVCVCVCVRERERGGGEQINNYINFRLEKTRLKFHESLNHYPGLQLLNALPLESLLFVLIVYKVGIQGHMILL